MRNFMIAGLLATLAVGTAFAADAKIESAAKTFKSVEADPAKVKTYCEMTKVMEAAGEKEDPATDAKIDGYIKALGSDFEAAWDTVENADENSADGKMVNDALSGLDQKCTG